MPIVAARSQDLRRTADASEYGGHPHSDFSPCNGDPPRHSRVRVQAEGLIAPVRAGVPYSGVVVNDQLLMLSTERVESTGVFRASRI